MASTVSITRKEFLDDRQGRTFADVLNDPNQPIDEVLEFFSNADRQRRMEESEIHHDRAALAGVVRELESLPGLNRFLGADQGRKNQRLRQATGVVVRMIMESRGWKKTGKKGSLGVRSRRVPGMPNHNTGGLAFWFLRAERYELEKGSDFRSVRTRCRELESNSRKGRSVQNRSAGSNGSAASHGARSTNRKPPKKSS
jgi:hypothetical protein